MGYKLADGSDSDLYEVGDTFTLTENGRKSDFKAGYLVKLIVPDPELAAFELPLFPPVSSIEDWSIMKPTPSTVRNVTKRNEHNPTMRTLEAVQQQPCVPIQFVWHNGYVNHVSGFEDVSDDLFGNCEVEQIGAVLYVRGK